MKAYKQLNNISKKRESAVSHKTIYQLFDPKSMSMLMSQITIELGIL